MGQLADQERQTYQEVYDLIGELYGGADEFAKSPGGDLVPTFLSMIGDRPKGTILDAGCGAGLGALALSQAGFDVLCGDLLDHRTPEAQAFPFTQLNLWQPLRYQLRRGQVAWVYCADVMEHLPTQFVGLALDNMLRFCSQGLFLSINLYDDVAGPRALGKSLHQTVRPFTWWRDTLRELGRVVEARDTHLCGLYLVEPVR